MQGRHSFPPPLAASVSRLPQPQPRAWGTITCAPATVDPVLVLAAPEVSVRATAREATLGQHHLGRTGSLSSFSYLAQVAGVLGGLAALIATIALGCGFFIVVWATFFGVVGGAGLAAGVRRLTRECATILLPWDVAELACAIEHASAVAARHRGGQGYDAFVIDGVRAILWDALQTDDSLRGARLPLSRILSAVLARNEALLGPHARPAWYPTVTIEPSRHPMANLWSVEMADLVVAQLHAEAGLEPGL